MVKNLPATAEDVRDVDSTLGLGRSPGGGHGDPLQYSCLENPMDSSLVGLQSIGSHVTEVTKHTCTHVLSHECKVEFSKVWRMCDTFPE